MPANHKKEPVGGEGGPDAWSRFERAVDAAVKGGPKHKAAQKPPKNALRQGEGMPLLPKEQWRLERIPGGFVAAGIYDNLGHRHWVKFVESDLPNDLVSVEDLERLIVDPIHVPPV
jgi:hypothetical protein